MPRTLFQFLGDPDFKNRGRIFFGWRLKSIFWWPSLKIVFTCWSSASSSAYSTDSGFSVSMEASRILEKLPNCWAEVWRGKNIVQVSTDRIGLLDAMLGRSRLCTDGLLARWLLVCGIIPTCLKGIPPLLIISREWLLVLILTEGKIQIETMLPYCYLHILPNTISYRRMNRD